MPHSPFTETVYPAIDDLERCEQELQQHRDDYECDGELETKTQQTALLGMCGSLISLCRFLEKKLDAKDKKIRNLEETIKSMTTQLCQAESRMRKKNSSYEFVRQKLEKLENPNVHDPTKAPIPDTTLDSKFQWVEETIVPQKRPRCNS